LKLAGRAFGLISQSKRWPRGLTKAREYRSLLRLSVLASSRSLGAPKPQIGNARADFRLERDEGVVKPQWGSTTTVPKRCCGGAARAHSAASSAVNVGANQDSPDRVADYVKLIETFRRSRAISPSTCPAEHAGLRNLQQSPARRSPAN